METKKQPGITSQHLEAILASEGRQEDVEEEGMEDNETVSEKSSKKSASHACEFFFHFWPHNKFVIIIKTIFSKPPIKSIALFHFFTNIEK